MCIRDRKKILYTLLIIIVFRFGSVIPVPFLDISKLGELMSEAGQNSALGYINMLTGEMCIRDRTSALSPRRKPTKKPASFSL